MMTGNKPTLTGTPPEDALACRVSVQDPSVQDPSVFVDSVRDRLAWINERVEIAQELMNDQGWQESPEINWMLGTVEEFAELLRVHFAGVES